MTSLRIHNGPMSTCTKFWKNAGFLCSYTLCPMNCKIQPRTKMMAFQTSGEERSGKIEDDGHDGHRDRETPREDDVIGRGQRDQQHCRVDPHGTEFEEPHVGEHADQRQHDHRDAQPVKELVPFRLMVGGVVVEENLNVWHRHTSLVERMQCRICERRGLAAADDSEATMVEGCA